MVIPKMSFMQNLKDLVTKGSQGMVNERLKEHYASADEVMKLDRSDPEAMRRYTAEQNAKIQQQLDSNFGKNFISPENQANMERIQAQAIENQATMYQMLNQHKASQTATPEPPPAPPKTPDTNK
jgi:uncharacterized protein YkwD